MNVAARGARAAAGDWRDERSKRKAPLRARLRIRELTTSSFVPALVRPIRWRTKSRSTAQASAGGGVLRGRTWLLEAVPAERIGVFDTHIA
jgi:hypothetical protein